MEKLYDQRFFKKNKKKWSFHCLNCEKKISSHEAEYYYVWDYDTYGETTSKYRHTMLCSKVCVDEMYKKVELDKANGSVIINSKSTMTDEKAHEYFMSFAVNQYDVLTSTWRFSSWKRVKMDFDSYFDITNKYFDSYYQENRDQFVNAELFLNALIVDFQKDVEILEEVPK